MEITFNANHIIIIENRIIASFATIIKSTLNTIDAIMVLVENNENLKDRNVYCIDFEGKLKWQIQAPVCLHSNNEYTSIYLMDHNYYAYSISGVEYQIDVLNGHIIKSELIK